MNTPYCTVLTRCGRFGRNNFREAARLSSRKDTAYIDWPKLSYMVWDIPNLPGTYGERYNRLGKSSSYPKGSLTNLFPDETLKGNRCSYIKVAERELCTGLEHLESFMQNIFDRGGEGIILRDPHAPYQAGRCAGYIKHKVCTHHLGLVITTYALTRNSGTLRQR